MTLRGEPTPEDFARDREWRARAAERYAQKRRDSSRPVSGTFTRADADEVRRLQRQSGLRVDTGRPQEPLERRGGAEAPPKPAKARTRRPVRNDGPWRDECIAAYGHVCTVPGCGSRAIEMDHIKPRAQGGESVVENGLPLCGAWSATVPGGHHQMKTDGALRFDPDWFTDAQLAYLARIGWVDWDEDGKPYGEGWRHFTEKG